MERKPVFTGESLTHTNKYYTLNYIKPCTTEKGKKMAKIRLKNPPENLLKLLDKSRVFDEVKLFPDLGMARARLGKKQIMFFASGEISIRAADNREDVRNTVNLIIDAIKKES